jgi:hypothetical protein
LLANHLAKNLKRTLNVAGEESRGGGSEEVAGPSGAQPSVIEHQVDQILATIDGKVQRQRDEKL